MTAAMLTNGYVVMRTTSLLSFPAPVHNCKLLKGFSQSESQLLPLPDGPLTLKESVRMAPPLQNCQTPKLELLILLQQHLDSTSLLSHVS